MRPSHILRLCYAAFMLSVCALVSVRQYAPERYDLNLKCIDVCCFWFAMIVIFMFASAEFGDDKFWGNKDQ